MPPSNPKLDYNLQILEIANNWDFILDAYIKYKEGTLKHVDIIEKDCLDFIIKNNIYLDSYENSDDFIKLVSKSLE